MPVYEWEIKKNSVDNFHFDGIGANINIETGIIDTIGYDVHNNVYLTHPITGKQIIGFQIPYWEECKFFCSSCSKAYSDCSIYRLGCCYTRWWPLFID